MGAVLGNRPGSPLQEGRYNLANDSPKPSVADNLGALGQRAYSGSTPTYIANNLQTDGPEKQIGSPIGPNSTPYDQFHEGNAPGKYQTASPAPADFNVKPAVMRYVPQGSSSYWEGA